MSRKPKEPNWPLAAEKGQELIDLFETELRRPVKPTMTVKHLSLALLNTDSEVLQAMISGDPAVAIKIAEGLLGTVLTVALAKEKAGIKRLTRAQRRLIDEAIEGHKGLGQLDEDDLRRTVADVVGTDDDAVIDKILKQRKAMMLTTAEVDDAGVSLAITEAGYTIDEALYGMAWADTQAFTTQYERFLLAMSRILYSDEQLADGARFTGVGASL